MVQLSSRQIKLSSGATVVLSSSLDHPLATVLPRWMPPVEKVFADPRGKAMAMAILPPGISEDCREHHLNSENTIGGRVKHFLALQKECKLTPSMAMDRVAATVKLCEVLEACGAKQVSKFFDVLAKRCNSGSNFRNVEQTILHWVKLLTPEDGEPSSLVLEPLEEIERYKKSPLTEDDLRNISSDFISHDHGNRFLLALAQCLSAYRSEDRDAVGVILRSLGSSAPYNPILGLPEAWACLALKAINGRMIYQGRYDFLMQTRDSEVLARPATEINYDNMVSAERASCVIRQEDGRKIEEVNPALALAFVQQLNRLSDKLLALAAAESKGKTWDRVSTNHPEGIQHFMIQVRTLSEAMSVEEPGEKSKSFAKRLNEYKRNVSALESLAVLDRETYEMTFKLLTQLAESSPIDAFSITGIKDLVKGILRQVEITRNFPEVFEFLGELVEKRLVTNVSDLAVVLGAALDRAAKEAPGTYSPVFWKQLKVTVKQPQKTK